MIKKQAKLAYKIKIEGVKRWLEAVLLSLCLAASSVLAIDENDLLDADVAFAISINANDRDEITVGWDIAEGYYLYKHAFRFVAMNDDASLGEPVIPSGKRYEDEFFGEVETYRGQVTISLPIEAAAETQTVTVRVSYQGCADLGVCYPPINKELSVGLPRLNSENTTSLASGSGLDNALANFGQSQGGLLDAKNDEALPAEQAFQYEAIAIKGDELLVRMTAAPGYYLYRDKLAFSTDSTGVEVSEVLLPAGIAKYDEHFGDVEVYYDQVEIPLYLKRLDAAALQIKLQGDFQGCKEKGICYPPMSRQVSIDLPEFEGIIGAVTAEQPISEQDRLAAILTGSPVRAMFLFLLAGLLLAFTPCVFPMVPILSGIIAGQGKQITTRRALLLSIIYVLAMALTYAAAGVFAGMSGSNLQAAFQNPWIISAFSLLFVGLSMSMFGFYELQLPASWQARLSALSNRQRGGTLAGVAVMGVLSALIVGPCVAPALAAALIYIGQTGNAVLGGTALFAMALGMGIPLVVFGVSAGTLLPRAGGWMNAVKNVFGVGMLALAVWMLERILPGSIILLMWSMLFIGSGIYLGALDSAEFGWPRLRKTLGVALLLFGSFQMLGFALGGDDWVRPLRSASVPGMSAASQQAGIRHFERIKTVADLRARIGQGQPVIFDFYADWCIECKRMEKYTFPEPEVQQAIKNVALLQADVTANDAEDKALLKEFGLIGPPAILFFNASGEEQRAARVIGYLNAADFSAHARRWTK